MILKLFSSSSSNILASDFRSISGEFEDTLPSNTKDIEDAITKLVKKEFTSEFITDEKHLPDIIKLSISSSNQFFTSSDSNDSSIGQIIDELENNIINKASPDEYNY